MSSCCRSRSLSPGSWTSNTRQLGTSGLGKAKNSCAEGKVCTLNVADRTRLPRASRTDSSSSTTYTSGLVLLIDHLLLIEKDSSKAPQRRTPIIHHLANPNIARLSTSPFRHLFEFYDLVYVFPSTLGLRAASIAFSKSSSLNGLSK